MIGDSITDFERARPVGEGLHEAIGKSCVGIVEALLRVTCPQSRVRVVNMGISGSRAAFNAYSAHYSAQTIAWDRIHPNVPGQVPIARAILNAIGFHWQGA